MVGWEEGALVGREKGGGGGKRRKEEGKSIDPTCHVSTNPKEIGLGSGREPL